METSTESLNAPTQTQSEPPAPVKLTDKASAMVKETIEREGLQGSGLRVAVVGGGCSGFQYSLASRRTCEPATWCSRSTASSASSTR